MSRINVLPKNIADLIAAGEVVERPSSIIKEFVENSIDAGASKITVEISNGGKTYIRVADNGCGIERDDIRKAFLSHATSKISCAQDLDAIMTLGFRGEALASISAVSRVELITRAASDETGTRYVIEGGEEQLLDDAGCPVGTTLIVRDIFYNTPARQKFLKKDVQEGNYIASVLERVAVSHSEVAFKFIRDGKPVFSTPGDRDVKAAIYAVFGREFTEQLIPVCYENAGVKVTGFTVKPIAGRGSRSMQMFYINGRYVKSVLLMSALEAAYKNSVMVGKFPACVLFTELPAETVDVNVHPAKTEVRLYDERRVFDCVYNAVLSSINADTERPQASFNAAKVFKPEPQKGEQLNISETIAAPERAVKQSVNEVKSFKIAEYGLPVSGAENVLHSPEKTEHETLDFLKDEYVKPVVRNITITSGEKTHIPEVEADVKCDTPVPENTAEEIDGKVVNLTEESPQKPEPKFRFIGEAFRTYLFAEVENKLLMIDKHAAHERILFEKYKKERSSSAQLLLSPVTVSLSADEYNAVIENIDLLRDAGYEIDDFGGTAVKINSCPAELTDENISEILTEIASYLALHIKTLIPEKLDWIYHSMACRAAVKAGNFTTDYEAERFVKELLKRDDIRYCPHGRPVMIEITRYELEKQFKRIV